MVGETGLGFSRGWKNALLLVGAGLLLAAGCRPRAAPAPAAVVPDDSPRVEAHLADVVARLARGEALGTGERNACHERFAAYFAEVRRRTGAEDLYGVSRQDSAEHYVISILMAVIDPERHGGWPTRHVRLQEMLEPLKAGAAASDRPAWRAAVIIPAIAAGETDTAVASYEALARKDPFLAGYILGCVKQYGGGGRAKADFLAKVEKSGGANHE